MNIDEKIANAEKRLKELKEQQRAVKARERNALNKKKRAEDTRRKILVGSLSLELMNKDETAKQRFLKQLDGYLTRDDDRALFDLTPISKQQGLQEIQEGKS